MVNILRINWVGALLVAALCPTVGDCQRVATPVSTEQSGVSTGQSSNSQDAGPQSTEAYLASRIWTGTGPPIEDGAMLVTDGKIVAVGPAEEVEIPEAATVHRLGNRVIIPGLVVARTSLIQAEELEKAITPEIRALDGFDFFDEREDAIRGGVTTVQITPGQNRLLPGIGAVVKLSGEDPIERILAGEESLQIVLHEGGRNPGTIYEPPVGPVSIDRPLRPTQPQLAESLPGALAGLRLLFRRARSDQQYVTEEPDDEPDTWVEPVKRHLEETETVRFSVSSLPEFRGAVELASEYSLSALLVGTPDLRLDKDYLRSWLDEPPAGIRGVVLAGRAPGGIANPSPEEWREQREPWEYARHFLDAGLPISICPASDGDLTDLLFVAGQFRRGGLTTEQVLKAVTAWPAELLGVDHRVGSLAPGKDADFIVLTSDPFQLRSIVKSTYSSGRKVYDRHSEDVTSVIRGGRVYTSAGNFVDDGSVVVQGQHVRGIGRDVSAPLDARIHDFGDAVVVPGFIDLGSRLGIGGELSGNISLDTKLGDQLYPDDPAIEYARRHGITTVLLGALDSNRPTPLVAFKLGDDARVLADPIGIRFRVGDNPASSLESLENALEQGKEYHESWLDYEKALAEYEAKQAQQRSESGEDSEASKSEPGAEDGDAGSSGETEKGEGESEPGEDDPSGDDPSGDDPSGDEDRDEDGDTDDGGDAAEDEDGDADSDDKSGNESEGGDDAESEKEGPPEKPEVKEEMEPYRALFQGKIPAFVEARRADAISAAATLFSETYGVRTIIVGADDLARFPDLLAEHDVAVCAGPQLQIAVDQQKVNLPQLLANQGVPFAFQSAATSGVGQLPGAVQYAVAQGLGVPDGLRGLTESPATLLGSELSVGKLAEGNDADLVVLSGPPFEHATEVLAVMIDGRWVYDREDEQ